MRDKVTESMMSKKNRLLMGILREGSEGNSFTNSRTKCAEGEHILLSSLYIWESCSL